MKYQKTWKQLQTVEKEESVLMGFLAVTLGAAALYLLTLTAYIYGQ